ALPSAVPEAVAQTAPAAATGWSVAPSAARRTTASACARSLAAAGSFVRRRAHAAPEPFETAGWPDSRDSPGAARRPSALRPSPRYFSPAASPAPDAAVAVAAFSRPASGRCTGRQPLRAAALLPTQPSASCPSHPRFGAIRPHQVVKVAQHFHIVQRALHLLRTQNIHLRRFLRRLDRRHRRPLQHQPRQNHDARGRRHRHGMVHHLSRQPRPPRSRRLLDARKQTAVEIHRNRLRLPRFQRLPYRSLAAREFAAASTAFQVRFQRRGRASLQPSRRILQQQFRSLPCFHWAVHVDLFLPYAIWAKRARSVSYARNSSDFTADSEQVNTFAICEYSISSYLCISTAARCFSGSVATARRTSSSRTWYTILCSTVGRASETCLAGMSGDSSSSLSCSLSFLPSRSAFNARCVAIRNNHVVNFALAS